MPFLFKPAGSSNITYDTLQVAVQSHYSLHLRLNSSRKSLTVRFRIRVWLLNLNKWYLWALAQSWKCVMYVRSIQEQATAIHHHLHYETSQDATNFGTVFRVARELLSTHSSRTCAFCNYLVESPPGTFTRLNIKIWRLIQRKHVGWVRELSYNFRACFDIHGTTVFLFLYVQFATPYTTVSPTVHSEDVPTEFSGT